MARFGLSRAPLYRRFAAEGGIHAYICDRRLVAAMRRLTHPGEAPRPMVARLAHEAGFANARVFSRAFHREYGLWPAEVKSSHTPGGGSTSDPPLTWLRDL
ncbi:helix-turn-helix domain-containing protein [Methylobacterium sp. Leaf85]|uniref:helix-turn-helix domain-containing protein n=1 Tax=Methylobacterium sp. Leaf85 TaxID=1736241 RepID=UPI003FCE33BD